MRKTLQKQEVEVGNAVPAIDSDKRRLLMGGKNGSLKLLQVQLQILFFIFLMYVSSSPSFSETQSGGGREDQI